MKCGMMNAECRMKGRAGPRLHSAFSSQHSASGFTLLELVIVMAILCVVAGLAAPTLRNFGEGRRVAEASAQLLAAANFARTHAIHEAVTYRLNLDPKAGTYWLTAWREGAYVGADGSFGRVFTAPDGVTLDWDAPLYADGQYVEFYPTGRVTPVVIQLKDRGGGVTAVGCPSSAEPFRVLWETPAQG